MQSHGTYNPNPTSPYTTTLRALMESSSKVNAHMINQIQGTKAKMH